MSISWRKLFYLLSTAALLASLLSFGHHRQQREQFENLGSLARSQPETALEILEGLHIPSSLERQADELKMACLTSLQRRDELLWLYDLKPQLFAEAQESRLLVGQALLQLGRREDLKKLLDHHLHSDSEAPWFFLKIDLLLMQGESKLAIPELLSRKFTGRNESERLMRLALLAKEFKTRWQLLQEATSVAPRYAKVYKLRARHFESLGLDSQALSEYEKVRVLRPGDPQPILRLGFFHLRRRNYDLALSVWERLAPEQAPTQLVEFLEFVTRGRPLPPQTASLDLFDPWLKLLQSLEKRDLAGAELSFLNSTQAYRLDPLLAWGVKQLLYHQGIQSWQHERATSPSLENQHRFFMKLQDPQSAGPIADSPHAYSALFLAGGWLHTGLRLPHPPRVPESYPDWYAFALGQAYRLHRGPSDTRAFLLRNLDHRGCRLLLAEQMLSEGSPEEALQTLEPLLLGDSAESFRAAWLSTTLHLENRQAGKAKQTLRACKSFREHTLGQELESRIHLLLGEGEEAEKRYLNISEESLEAQVYLASKALERKDLQQARFYTLKALQNAPEAPEIRRNLSLLDSLEEKT